MESINHWHQDIGSQNIHLSKVLKDLKRLVQYCLRSPLLLKAKKTPQGDTESSRTIERSMTSSNVFCSHRVVCCHYESKWRQILTLLFCFIAKVPLISLREDFIPVNKKQYINIWVNFILLGYLEINLFHLILVPIWYSVSLID